MKNNFKKFVCFTCSFMVLFFSFPLDIFAEVEYHDAYDPEDSAEYTGVGKEWNELNNSQKAARVSVVSDIIGKALVNTVADGVGAIMGKNISITDLSENFRDYYTAAKQIGNGNMSYYEWVIRESGLGDVIESKDFNNDSIETEVKNIKEVTISPDLLNTFQDYIDSVNSDGRSNYYCVSSRSSSEYATNKTINQWTSDDRAYISFMSEYVSRLVNQYGLVFVENNGWQHRIWYLEGEITDYYIFRQNDVGIGNLGMFSYLGFKRKDGEDAIINCRSIGYQGEGDTWDNGLTRYCCQGPFIYSWTTLTGYDDSTKKISTLFLASPDHKDSYYCTGNNAFAVTNNGRIKIYESVSYISSLETFGDYGKIPEIIQHSDNRQYHNESYTSRIDNSENYAYNYNYVINNLGDTTGLSQDEIDKKIDEVLAGLKQSIDSGTRVNEEGFDNISSISSDNNELLNRILYEVREIKNYVADFDSGSSGNIFDKFNSLLTLLTGLTDLFTNFLADEITDLVETGGEIIGDVVEIPQLLEIQLKLDTIIGQLGAIILDDKIDDAQEFAGDIFDTVGTEIGNEIITKFPFSIPWDIALIIETLAAIPQVPYFELPLNVPSFSINETIIVDLSDMQLLSEVARWFFDILFGLAITKLTLKILQIDIVHT